MRSETEHNTDDAIHRELRLLTEMERTPQTTQRSLSRRVGVGLGVTNLLLRGLAHRGYVRVTRAGWRSWVYTLTPAGISRKVRLTGSYIQRVLSDYADIRQTLSEELERVGVTAKSRVALYGVGEFAELTYLALSAQQFEQVDLYFSEPLPNSFMGLPLNSLADYRPDAYDWVIVAAVTDVEEAVQKLVDGGVPRHQVLTLFEHGEELTGEMAGER